MGMCNCNFHGQVVVSYEIKVPETKQQTLPKDTFNLIKTVNKLNQPINKSPQKKCLTSNQLEVNNKTSIPSLYPKKASKRSTLLMKYSMDVSQSQSTIEQFSRAQTLQSRIEPNGNKDNPENSTKNVFNKENGQLFYYLQCHFLFYHFPSELLKSIYNIIKVAYYEKDQLIPIENMLLIKNGQIELKEENKVLVLSIGDTFGESALLNTKDKMIPPPYTATALSNTEVYCFSYDDYQLLKNKQNDETMNDIEEKFDIINKMYLFDCVDQRFKIKVASMIITAKFSTRTVLYSKRKRFKITTEHELRSQKLIFIIKSGLLSVHALDNTQLFEKGNIIGADQLLFFPNDKTEYKFHPKEESECYVIPEKLFIETFGLNYREKLIYDYFDYVLKRSEPIMKMLKGEKSIDLFKSFSINQYKPNEIVISRGEINYNTKYILVLEGELMNSKVKNKVLLNKGSFYGDDCLNSTEE